jgi:hypothetical protein
MIEARQSVAAVDVCESQIHRHMKNPDALRIYAIALTELGRYDKALGIIAKAVRLRPMDAHLRASVGKILAQAGRHEEAVAEFRRVLALHPVHTETLDAMVSALRHLRRDDEAYAAVTAAAEAGAPPDGYFAHALAEASRGVGREAEAVGMVAAALERSDVQSFLRWSLGFQLGRLHERLGGYDAAFEAFRAANESVPAFFDPAAHKAAADALIGAWFSVNPMPPPGQPEDPFVFIVGMPRSGTTLVEQILAANPAAATIGESVLLLEAAHRAGMGRPPFGYPASPRALRADLLKQTADAFVAEARRLAGAKPGVHIIDKLPINAMFVPFAALMLPNARFIACDRDPRDTGLSCYQQFFSGGTSFAYDLTHIAHMQADMTRVVRAWAERLPDRVEVVQYERLVAEPEAHARSLSAHAGLPFHERSLRFWESDNRPTTASYDQVSRPVYTSSVGRWRRYERHLQPLVQTLVERGVELTT